MVASCIFKDGIKKSAKRVAMAGRRKVTRNAHSGWLGATSARNVGHALSPGESRIAVADVLVFLRTLSVAECRRLCLFLVRLSGCACGTRRLQSMPTRGCNAQQIPMSIRRLGQRERMRSLIR